MACSSPEQRVAEHLRRANQYFENEQWSEARIEFWNALKLDPDHSEAHYRMGEALMHLQQFRDGAWEYREAVRLAPDNLEWRMKLAELYVVFNASDDALEQIGAVLERAPDHVDALVLRAVILARKREAKEALAQIDRALEINPKHERALQIRARALELVGDGNEAEATYRRLLEGHPSTANHLRFALFFGSREKPLRALGEYEEAIRAAKDQGERTRARRILALFHLSREDPDAAERELIKAREEAPDDSALALTLARLYARQGYAERAEEMLENRVKSQPDRVDPLLTLADFYRRSGDREKALETSERALAIDPESEAARLQKAEYLIERRGDLDALREGRTIVDQILEENPNSGRGLLTLAKALLLDGNYEEAAAKTLRVLDRDPSSQGQLLLGWSYIGMGQHELARSALLRSIQLDPDNSTARTELAALYLRTGQSELAAEEARKVMEGGAVSPRILLVLAEVEARLGHPEEALRALEQISLDGSPDAPAHRLSIGRLYRRLGKDDLARAHLEAVAKADPENTTAIRELVSLDLGSRDPEAALARLNQALQDHPESGALYALRGAVHLGFRQADGTPPFATAAEQDLKTAIEKDPMHVRSYTLLATLYRLTGRTQEAIGTFEQAREARPDEASVHLVLGTLYEQSGRAEEAILEYEDVVRLDPKQPIAKNNLAWLLAESSEGAPEKLDRALTLAQDARELLPDNPNVADTLGWVLLKRDAPTAAVPLFREAIANLELGDENRSLIRYHLAQAYVRNGQDPRAIEQLEHALEETSGFPSRDEAEALLTKLRAS